MALYSKNGCILLFVYYKERPRDSELELEKYVICPRPHQENVRAILPWSSSPSHGLVLPPSNSQVLGCKHARQDPCSYVPEYPRMYILFYSFCFFIDF